MHAIDTDQTGKESQGDTIYASSSASPHQHTILTPTQARIALVYAIHADQESTKERQSKGNVESH